MDNQQPQQMPVSQQASVPGEAAISQQTVQQVSPDVASPQGQQQLFQKAVQAHVVKKTLDAVLQAVAGHIGATTESRVKQIETVAAKVTQKRLSGRDYDMDDINDMLGERLIITKDEDLPKAKEAIKKLEQAGIFTINKSERVNAGTYSAWHLDGEMQGTKFEIQIMNKKEEAESLINHGLRAVAGENPQNKAVQQLKEKQASIVKNMSDEKAQAVSGAIKSINQQNNNKPVSPQTTASVLAQAQQ